MRKYEMLLLLSPDLGIESRQEICSTLTGVIEREKGSMLTTEEWGLKQLAYPIRKMTRGYYVRLEFMLLGSSVAELERITRITDGIFRFVTVKLEEASTN